MMFKKIIILFAIFLLAFLMCLGGFVYFVFTEKGSQIVARHFLKNAFTGSKISFAAMKGNFGVGFKLEDLEIENVEKLPKGSVVRIQELVLMNSIWDFQRAHLVLKNGRIILPDADPILVYGDYKEDTLNFSVYTKSFNIDRLKEIFDAMKMPYALTGSVENIDMHISGSRQEPVIAGNLYIRKLIYQDFTLIESPVTVSLKFEDQPEGYIPSGVVILERGNLLAKNTVVNLQQSTFFISKDIKDLSFSVYGNSRIEDVDIQMAFSGTADHPDIELKSNAGLSTERLFLMLATGKRWKGLDAPLEKQKISPDLVKDLIDYLVFSGSGDKLANKLGLKNVFLNLEKDKKGVGVKKTVINNLDVGYEINKVQTSSQQQTIQQRVSGDVKVSNKITVSVEKEVRPTDAAQKSFNDASMDDKILLKYDTKF